MELNLKELGKFIIEAKLNSYASGKKGTKLSDGSEEFTFEKGRYSYVDRYFGNNRFTGHEIVSKDNTPVWGMNYYGHLTKKVISLGKDSQVTKFLQESLRNLKDIEKPFRGPLNYTSRDKKLQYFNNPYRSIDSFHGHESIYGEILDSSPLFILSYHGGIIV